VRSIILGCYNDNNRLREHLTGNLQLHIIVKDIANEEYATTCCCTKKRTELGAYLSRDVGPLVVGENQHLTLKR
jgi:hypothetical protein